MLTDQQWSPVTFILRQFHKRCLNQQSLKSIWKWHLKVNSNFPEANELMHPVHAWLCFVVVYFERVYTHSSCLLQWHLVSNMSAMVPALRIWLVESYQSTNKWLIFRQLGIFSCDQAALRTLISVCPSACLPVCLSHLLDNVPVIVSSRNFQLKPLTNTMSMQKVKVRGQRSRSQSSWPHLAIFGR